jgi:hypothetical protein
MAQCSYCGSTIIFGGVREGNLQFCNARCLESGYPLIIAQDIPRELAESKAWEIHSGSCPRCGGEGPIDVHKSYKIWSAIYHSSWKCEPNICCRKCGVRLQLKSMVFSFFLGWWGLPAGFLVTPIQIGKNIYHIFCPPSKLHPSEDLIELTTLDISHQYINRDKKIRACPHCGASYDLSDYCEDAPKIYCSCCKQEIPREETSNNGPEFTCAPLRDSQETHP